jgi:hypothetical protein
MKLISTIKEKLSMARPRLLKPVEGGEILLKNCTTEVFEKVKAALEGTTPSYSVVAEAPPEIEDTEETEVLPNKAIGVYRDTTTLSHFVATINFNPITKKARIEKLENNGSPAEAAEKFKKTAVKFNFV